MHLLGQFALDLVPGSAVERLAFSLRQRDHAHPAPVGTFVDGALIVSAPAGRSHKSWRRASGDMLGAVRCSIQVLSSSRGIRTQRPIRTTGICALAISSYTL